MSNAKKMLQAAAGNAGGASLDITDVFSTFLYTGNDSTQAINNGIDLDGEGGLLWIKPRNLALPNRLMDSARGPTKYLVSDTTGQSQAGAPFSFGSNGFSLTGGGSSWNGNTNTYASWTFRKAEKFFDVVTYTGNGASSRAISHNLGSTVGMLVVKRTSGADNWTVFHRGMDATAPEDYTAYLNTTEARANQDLWADTAPTDSVFSVGSNIKVNGNGSTYVAYLFAHNNNDGDFGPDGDQDIIKCGKFSVNGSYEADVDIGFEPQWVLIKPVEDAASWVIFDTMRGAVVNGDASWLAPNLSQAEANTANRFWPTSTGFHIGNYGITAGNDIIYMAIRRGPLAVPKVATKVFAIDEGDGVGAVSAYTSGFPVDFAIDRTATATSPNYVATRLLQGKRLQTDGTNAEASESAYFFDFMKGWRKFARAAGNYSYMWKRAPSFHDVVTYNGDSNDQVVSHGLGIKPDMIIIKARSATGDWSVYHSGLTNSGVNYSLKLNTSAAEANTGGLVANASTFTLYDTANVNTNGRTYVAYLFATTPGVSKVGSVSHSGSSTDVNCGFSSGARFVMLKRSNATGDWYYWDSVRGIVAGNDPYLLFNTTAAQVTNTDYIDPLSSGFTITGDFTDGTYIFYAIA